MSQIALFRNDMSADALLDALLAAVRSGDHCAAAYLPIFTRWYASTRLAPMPDVPTGLLSPRWQTAKASP